MMSPKDKKTYTCHSVSLDRLSSLPGNLIDDILVRLPIRYAVRTSILSKKWRYKWCTLPELDLTRLRIKEDSVPVSVKITNIVNHIVTLHSGPVIKCTLYFTPDLVPYPTIDNLMYFLSTNHIQHLVLILLTGYGKYKLPCSFFACSCLRHLTLQNCLIELPPPSFKGFDKLTSLELIGVTISCELLESLISNSSLLEQLVLKLYGISDVIEVKAPMLKSFDFDGRIRFICLKHVPRLAKISLKDNGCSVDEAGKCDIAKFFESLSVLEHLHLNGDSLKFFAAGPVGILTVLNSVKRLYLSDIYLDQLDVVSCALCLIKSCPYLQYMEIQVDCVYDYGDDHDDSSPAIEFLEEGFSDVTFSHLREVKLEGNIATEPGIELIKLLLAKSPVLVRMLINPSINEDDREKFNDTLYRAEEMVDVVEEYLDESPKEAKVIYNIEYDPDCYYIFEM